MENPKESEQQAIWTKGFELVNPLELWGGEGSPHDYAIGGINFLAPIKQMFDGVKLEELERYPAETVEFICRIKYQVEQLYEIAETLADKVAVDLATKHRGRQPYTVISAPHIGVVWIDDFSVNDVPIHWVVGQVLGENRYQEVLPPYTEEQFKALLYDIRVNVRVNDKPIKTWWKEIKERRKVLGDIYLKQENNIWVLKWNARSRQLFNQDFGFIKDILGKLDAIAQGKLTAKELWLLLDKGDEGEEKCLIERTINNRTVSLRWQYNNSAYTWQLNYLQKKKRVPRHLVKHFKTLIESGNVEEISNFMGLNND